MLRFGVVVLGVIDVQRAAEFWSATLGYELREDGFGGWAKVLVPSGGAGTAIALQLSRTPPQDHPRLHLDLHAADAGEQAAEAARLVSLGAKRVMDWDSYPEDPDFIVLEDPEGTRRREYAPLEAIADNHPKYVLSLDPLAGDKSGGIHHLRIPDFLLIDAY